MRKNQRCPKCEGTELWVVDQVQQPEQESSNTTVPLRVTTSNLDGIRTEVGTFEAWICNGCGYTEWYAKDVQALAYLAQQYDAGVRLVRGGVEPKGYR